MKIKSLIYTLSLAFFLLGPVNIHQIAAEAQGQFVGSINSNIYHYPSCRYAKIIKPENQIWFIDAADALNHGYRPCTVCNPPLPEYPSALFIVFFAGMSLFAAVAVRKKLLKEYCT